LEPDEDDVRLLGRRRLTMASDNNYYYEAE
jgi:hypothetical protein